MAYSKTPEKRARQAENNRLKNSIYKTKLKTAVKKYQTLIAANEKEAAQESLKKVISLIDKSVGKGILHKNNAAHKKSSLTKELNKINA